MPGEDHRGGHGGSGDLDLQGQPPHQARHPLVEAGEQGAGELPGVVGGNTHQDVVAAEHVQDQRQRPAGDSPNRHGGLGECLEGGLRQFQSQLVPGQVGVFRGTQPFGRDVGELAEEGADPVAVRVDDRDPRFTPPHASQRLEPPVDGFAVQTTRESAFPGAAGRQRPPRFPLHAVGAHVPLGVVEGGRGDCGVDAAQSAERGEGQLCHGGQVHPAAAAQDRGSHLLGVGGDVVEVGGPDDLELGPGQPSPERAQHDGGDTVDVVRRVQFEADDTIDLTCLRIEPGSGPGQRLGGHRPHVDECGAGRPPTSKGGRSREVALDAHRGDVQVGAHQRPFPFWACRPFLPWFPAP